ncbi:hypothetical protein SGFS_014190 [Streptomyces graminofaciens]|jgi:hypothetical protein|uniref:Histidine kinase n=1 Tax=Streptomyces graminofaciens TaxID=68212 RepID=A0ABN5VBS6_9ACTN|nr:hypothetical protein [Streptomyces graminofaciens]BBC30125.1 hypothetical protein SGFS_014190 [Streptomyces graminofaciens]
MPGSDLGELLGTVDRLARCVDSLRSARPGEPTAFLDLADDVERLRVNVSALVGEQAGSAPAGERPAVHVSDMPYDSGLWHGADDEGVGGHRPQVSPILGHAGF